MPGKTRLRDRITAFAVLLLILGGCSHFTFNAEMCDRVISDHNTQNIPTGCGQGIAAAQEAGGMRRLLRRETGIPAVTYEIVLRHIFRSPAHNYFTRPRFEAGDAPAVPLDSVRLEAGLGIPGDRFYASHYPVTFFSLEVAEAIAEAFPAASDPSLFRRNIIVSGVNLNELIGERFTVNDVAFEGISHCSPCPWMDAVMGKGVYKMMVGRGGLRAKVTAGGSLKCGRQMLQCDKTLAMHPCTPLARKKLP
jgi:hypothetical protein